MNENDERSAWAEGVETFAAEARLTTGDAASARARSLIEDAVGGVEALEMLEKKLRGRPTLTFREKPRGYESPKRTFRLTEKLDDQLTTYVSAAHMRPSDVMRDALTEYFDRHRVS